MIEVEGVVNPIINIGIIASPVLNAIAFHELDAFLPTHAPAIVGNTIVISVRGICNEPVTVPDAFNTCSVLIGE